MATHYVRIESWAGSHVVPVEVVRRTRKRILIRFLEDCQKAKRGDERFVSPSVVRAFAVTGPAGERLEKTP